MARDVSAGPQRSTIGIVLPLFITEKNKYLTGFLMFGFASLIYLISNHMPILPPQALPMSIFDLKMPFIPETVWIYLSEWPFFAVLYVMSKDMKNLNQYFYSFLAVNIASVICFVTFPTTYPRELFPLPEGLDHVTASIFEALRKTDAPNNCCPSLHVSSVYLSCLLFRHEQKQKFGFFLLWATLIALSTMTTKQHYLIDVVSGVMMAFFVYMFFHRYVRYRTARSSNTILQID